MNKVFMNFFDSRAKAMQKCAPNLRHVVLSQSSKPLALLLLLQGVLAPGAALLPVTVPSKAEPGSDLTSAEALGKAAAGHTRMPETPDPTLLSTAPASYLLEISSNVHIIDPSKILPIII